MKKTKYYFYLLLILLTQQGVQNINAQEKNAHKPNGFNALISQQNLIVIANAVFEWQIEEYNKNQWNMDNRDWRVATLYNGMMDWIEITDNKTYENFLLDIFNKQDWQVAIRKYHADDINVSQSYLDLYIKYKEEKMIKPTLERVDWVMANPPEPNIDITKGKSSRWWWCDALYMAPPVYARLFQITGDSAYIDFAHQEYLATYNHLYNADYKLFYRDAKYFDKKEANGQPVFWSRGNGWVMAGLAELLKQLDINDQKYRPFYEQLFKEMSEQLVRIQSSNGSWSSSLLDSETYSESESSGTGLITYALAYGINSGLLDKKKFLPAVTKGWQALVSNISADGRVGWVQLVAQTPGTVKEEDTEVYGAGAILMTASELYKMCN